MTEPREYEETAIGPVIHRTADRLFVVRSINLEWWRHYEGFFELLHARSLTEFRRTLGRGLVVSSNYTYADVDGNILYAWNARLPRRPDPAVDYQLDVPGDSGRLFWKGIHRLAELPWLLNPPGGYVQNANNPPWWTSLRDRLDPARYPSYIERGELSLRAQVILEALDATARFSPDAVRQLKFSTRMLAADRLLPDLVAAAPRVPAPSEPLRAGLDTLTAWDRRVSAGSRGAVLFERFVSIYSEQYPDRFAIPWNPPEPMTTPMGLADPNVAVAALERAVVEVRQQYGSERVVWGGVNRFRFGDIDLPGDGSIARHGLFRVVAFDAAQDGMRVAGHVGPNRYGSARRRLRQTWNAATGPERARLTTAPSGRHKISTMPATRTSAQPPTSERSSTRKRRSSPLVKIVVALGVLAVLGVLFVRSVRDARSTPYTIEPELLRNWTVAFEPASSPTEPVLALRPPPELAIQLFRQVFARSMESLSSPTPAAIPLVLQGEFDRAFAGRVTPDALVAAARNAGLESATLEPRCLAYRRVSEPGVTRQLFFAVFDAPAFGRFREDIGALLGGAVPRADFDPTALSPVLIIAASEPTVGRWLPLRVDPEIDCVAPIVTG